MLDNNRFFEKAFGSTGQSNEKKVVISEAAIQLINERTTLHHRVFTATTLDLSDEALHQYHLRRLLLNKPDSKGWCQHSIKIEGMAND